MPWGDPSGPGLALCVDFGSTFTKALLVDLDNGDLLGTAEHPTTIDTDVLDGLDACRAALRDTDARVDDAQVLACSSAGGGLRIAVLGNEALVTAEAGRRVALSSGGRVVVNDDVVRALGVTPQQLRDVDQGNVQCPAVADEREALKVPTRVGPISIGAAGRRREQTDPFVVADGFDLDVRGLGQFTDLHRLHLLIATAQQLNRLTL